MVLLIESDQDECLNQACLANGVPNMRRIHVSRTVPGPEDVDSFIKPMMEALTRPLADKEKERGRFEVPNERIIFEGTLDEAQEFYQQTELFTVMATAMKDTPICKYTDGLPIIIPTEERVEKMLKGTSHKPDEVITFQSSHRPNVMAQAAGYTGIEGDVVLFPPMRRKATVEKVATIGVMAGCRPEYMPVLLAIAEAGGGCGDGRGSQAFCVSGPIAREIGMNFDVGVLGPGNTANRSIGRAAELMWRNFGGNIPAVTNCGIMGSPLFNCIPENAEALPPGWEGLNEEYDFKKDESIVFVMGLGAGGSTEIHNTQFMPGGYRELQKSGHGGIARRLGVKGIAGPHNWLEYITPGLWSEDEGGITLLLLPQMALDLQRYGFKSKDEVYEWLYKKSFMPLAQYRTHQNPDLTTQSWLGIEKTSGKPWKELPDDYMVPAMNDPYENCIIVTGGGEERSQWLHGRSVTDPAYSIDAWK